MKKQITGLMCVLIIAHTFACEVTEEQVQATRDETVSTFSERAIAKKRIKKVHQTIRAHKLPLVAQGANDSYVGKSLVFDGNYCSVYLEVDEKGQILFLKKTIWNRQNDFFVTKTPLLSLLEGEIKGIDIPEYRGNQEVSVGTSVNVRVRINDEDIILTTNVPRFFRLNDAEKEGFFSFQEKKELWDLNTIRWGSKTDIDLRRIIQKDIGAFSITQCCNPISYILPSITGDRDSSAAPASAAPPGEYKTVHSQNLYKICIIFLMALFMQGAS